MEVLPDRHAGRTDRGPGIVAVLAAVLSGAVLLLLQGTGTTVVSVLLLVALTGIALRSGSSAAAEAILMADLLYATVAVKVLGPWPLPPAVAVVAAWGLAYRSRRATLWQSWLRRGRSTPETKWLLVSIIVITAFALVVWRKFSGGQLPRAYLDAAQDRPVWPILSAGAGFALINAAAEEALFRGVLQTSLEQLVGPVFAILIQASAFGLLHVVGIPTGLVGALMAGSWGVLLGVLRHRTRGILAPYFPTLPRT